MMEASTPSFPSSLHPTHRPRPSSCWFKDAGAHQYLWTTSHTHTPLHHFAQKPEIASSWEWSRSRRTEGKQSAFYAHSGAHFPAESALRGSSGPPRPIKKKKKDLQLSDTNSLQTRNNRTPSVSTLHQLYWRRWWRWWCPSPALRILSAQQPEQRNPERSRERSGSRTRRGQESRAAGLTSRCPWSRRWRPGRRWAGPAGYCRDSQPCFRPCKHPAAADGERLGVRLQEDDSSRRRRRRWLVETKRGARCPRGPSAGTPAGQLSDGS